MYHVHRSEEKVIAFSDFQTDESLAWNGDFSGSVSDYIVRNEKVFLKKRMPQKEMRIAMICPFGINCGISTYSKYLSDQLRLRVGHFKIFAEIADKENCLMDEAEGVTRRWNRNGSYSEILPEMEKFNPDIIFIQHEFGLFHRIDKFLSLMSQLSKWRTVVVLHTVLEHDVECENSKLDYTTRAIAESACREVIVHNKKARDTMKARGFSGLVHFVPHGCLSPRNLEKLPLTRYGMFSEHSIFQYGFGGEHKGWELAIDVVEKLKEKYPDIFYVGVFNVSSHSEDRASAYHEKLLNIIREKKLEENVAIIKGFQSEEMLCNFLRSIKICLFLYQSPNKNWSSWGASGAIQLPISFGLPMVLSDFCAFRELEGKLPLCKSTDEAAKMIDAIFSDPVFEKEMQEKSLALSKDRSWDRIASWYLDCKQDEEFNAPCL